MLLDWLFGKGRGQDDSTGKAGEDAAAGMLKSKGYKVVTRNFSTRFGEVDIICKQGDSLVFVEVKTRGANALAAPKESVGHAKMSRIKAAAKEYISRCGHKGAVRFDVVGVVLSGGAFEIEHIEDAFGD